MKKFVLLALLLSVAVLSNQAQTAVKNPEQRSFAERLAKGANATPEPDLPRFNLDFPGGTPDDLVAAIQDQTIGLNAIVPAEFKNERLPPLKMRGVNVKQLFEALELASQKKIFYSAGGYGPAPGFATQQQIISSSMGFRATGPINADTVWYFFVERPAAPSPGKSIRYYQLSPYLTNYKVDDITTAIQAGWKMLGETNMPELKYHQDTKLLIAVGQNSDLSLIDSVLQELGKELKTTQHAGSPYGPPTVTQPVPVPLPKF